MNINIKSSSQEPKKNHLSGMRLLFQTIVTTILTSPILLFAQTGHEGHSMESHSLVHWVITLVLLVVIIFGISKFLKNRRNK